MGHLVVCNIKVLVSNRALIFWAFAFPILLGVLFKLTLGDLNNQESFDTVPVAVVNSQTYQDSPYKTAFNELSKPGSLVGADSNKPMLKVETVASLTEGKKLLADEKVCGIVQITGTYSQNATKNIEAKLTIAANGMNETFLKITLDEISQRVNMVEKLVAAEIGEQISAGTSPTSINPAQIANSIQNKLDTAGFTLNDRSPQSMDLIMVQFFSLMAMACLYGGMFSMTVMNNTQPPLGVIGRRIAVAPTSKAKLIISGIISSYLVQLVGILVLLAVCHLIFAIDFGSNWGLTFLLTSAGALAGLACGAAISTLIPGGENMKIGTLISVTMLGSVLAGMMGGPMRYVIDQNVPLINKLNPVALITDGFYNLFYHPGFAGFWQDILLLVIISIVLLAASIFVLQRQRYDSL